MLIGRDHGVYAFGDQIVRPAMRPIQISDDRAATGLRLVPIASAHMAERFTRVIRFEKFFRQTNDWREVDCPIALAEAYLQRIGVWNVPQLTAVTTCPLLLSDGRILAKPGFDAKSGILFDPQGVEFPPIPPSPTPNGARQALDFLLGPFTEFPFVDEASKAVLASLLLSAVARFAVPFVPCHAFDAPAAGTGKSKLFDCASILLTGRECAVISQAQDEVEFEKKLFAIMLAGELLVSIDNCTRPIDNAFMCMVLTQRFVKSRILGMSKEAEIPTSVLFAANGNNFAFAGDMLRRGVTGRLDAGHEKPWEREFTTEDPVDVFKRGRPQYVVAALTVLRGYLTAGQPPSRAPPLGGFTAWARLVRDALIWLGMADPTVTIDTASAADLKRQQLEAVLLHWAEVIGDRPVTSREVIDEACGIPVDHNPERSIFPHPAFRDALLDVAGERGQVFAIRLGQWIAKNRGQVVGGLRLASATKRDGNGRWVLERQQPDGKWR